jgi:DNA polymerase III delta subunit
MPRHSSDDLHRALSRGELSPVYYLYGMEVVLREEALQTILDLALPAADRSFGLEQRSAVGLDPDELHGALNALPMFGARRVLVLRDTGPGNGRPLRVRFCSSILRTLHQRP